MKKEMLKRKATKGKATSTISYRIKSGRTANGLSHYVPAEKKTLV